MKLEEISNEEGWSMKGVGVGIGIRIVVGIGIVDSCYYKDKRDKRELLK